MAWKNRGLYGNQTLTNNLEDLEEYLDELEQIVNLLAPKSTTIYAGDGLIGTHDLSTDVTLYVGAGSGILVDADSVAVDYDTLDLRYSLLSHNHTGIYASYSHNHDSWYATIGHNHSGVYEPVDATILRQADVDDTPVDAATSVPVSSNWAYDHVAATDPHTGYVLESAVTSTPSNGSMDPISSDWAYDHGVASDPHTVYPLAASSETISGSWLFSSAPRSSGGWQVGADDDVVFSSGTGAEAAFRFGSVAYYGYAKFTLSGTTSTLQLQNTQVLQTRITGWGAPTGTSSRSTFASHSAQTISSPPTQTQVQNIDNSLVSVSQRLHQLIDDLMTHGLIGT